MLRISGIGMSGMAEDPKFDVGQDIHGRDSSYHEIEILAFRSSRFPFCLLASLKIRRRKKLPV